MKINMQPWKLFIMLMSLMAMASTVRSEDFFNITTNMARYVVQERTDTWTQCFMTLANGMLIESNAVVGLISTTNTCHLPVSSSYRQDNEIGRLGSGRLWAVDSRIDVMTKFDVGGEHGAGSMHLTNTTFVAHRDPSDGTFPMRVGNNRGHDAHTSVVELVNSTLTYNFSNGRNTSLNLGSSGIGRLSLENSSIGSSAVRLGLLTSGGGFLAPDQVVASFNASTVTAYRVRVGGDPQLAYSNGRYTFSNGSLLSLPAGWDAGELLVGYWGKSDYTSTVTVATASRVESVYPTFVGYKTDRGRGRLTFTDASVGRLNNDVILGYEVRSRGYLDVFSDSQVSVTNALGTASLVVGRAGYGQLSIDGGACMVDNLYLTNGVNSVLDFPSGLLRVKSGLISNDTTLTIGDGVGSAVFEQWGGGTTVVHGAMSFLENSQWRVDADASTEKVLDVAGELFFAPGVELSVATDHAFAALDGRVLAVADEASTRPDVAAEQELRVAVEEAPGGRQALILKHVKKGTVLVVR